VTPNVDGHVCEAEAARLLPWFVSGRLSAADTGRVAQHLEHCEICRDDVVEQRALRATLRTGESVEYAPQAGLAKTLARIDELTRESPTPIESPQDARNRDSRRHRLGLTQWLTAAVVVQAIGLGAIGGSYLSRQGEGAQAGFETRSTPPPPVPAARIRAVFAEAMTVSQLKALLAMQHLLIVAGPTEAGVFTLGVTDGASGPDHWSAPLAGLRADPHVLFAEPLSGDGLSPR
jgi:anti-sigma factor RsiW